MASHGRRPRARSFPAGVAEPRSPPTARRSDTLPSEDRYATEFEMDALTSTDDLHLWLDSHQLLWSLDEFLTLARFHSWIHDAEKDLSTRSNDEVASNLEPFRRLELTSVGREVGSDIPRWWIFTREANVQELHKATLGTFAAAQQLLRASEASRWDAPTSYESIIRQVRQLLHGHSREIELLLEYVASLRAKDKLAPAILFSYAVWGTTRRSERDLPAKSEMSETERLRFAGELAVGIRGQWGATLHRVWNDLVDEAESATQEDQPVAIPVGALLLRSQFQIQKRLTTYFEKVRDSLRHIDTLCQEFFQRENLFADDRFAKSLLQKVSRQPSAVETDLWDIKETLEVWEAPGDRKKAAAIRFVERVAAFANGRGGVLLIGVADKTHEVVGVRDPEDRMKHIQSMISRYAEADSEFVKVRTVDIEQTGVRKTCIVVAVGETESPVGVQLENGSYVYPLRVASGTERISRKELVQRKAHKKGTSFAFTRELNEWVFDAT